MKREVNVGERTNRLTLANKGYYLVREEVKGDIIEAVFHHRQRAEERIVGHLFSKADKLKHDKYLIVDRYNIGGLR